MSLVSCLLPRDSRTDALRRMSQSPDLSTDSWRSRRDAELICRRSCAGCGRSSSPDYSQVNSDMIRPLAHPWSQEGSSVPSSQHRSWGGFRLSMSLVSVFIRIVSLMLPLTLRTLLSMCVPRDSVIWQATSMLPNLGMVLSSLM